MWQVSSGLKEDEMVSQVPQCQGRGCQKFHFRYFPVSCSQTSSCARKPLVLRHRYMVYTCMWQVSSGLKEDEMGSQVPQYHGGVKIPFSVFFWSSAPRYMVYTSMWQVSSGLKEDEMGSQSHPHDRGGCKNLFSMFLGLLLPN